MKTWKQRFQVVNLILAIDTTGAVTRSTFSVGNDIEASLTTSTVRVSEIKLAFADRYIFFLLFLVLSIREVILINVFILWQLISFLILHTKTSLAKFAQTKQTKSKSHPISLTGSQENCIFLSAILAIRLRA
jgi:hypothetical protein